MDWWIQAVAGFGVGVLVGLTGIGGGALMTPLLVLAFGFAPAVAVGTDLLFASITKSGGVWVHTRRRTVEWRAMAWLAAGSLPAAALTLRWLGRWGANPRQFDVLIVPVLAVALTLTGAVLLFKTRVQRFAGQWNRTGHLEERRRPLATMAVGAVVGVLVTLTSIGAGALAAAALLFLHPRLPAVKVAGTDLAHAVPLAAVAGFGHWQLGTVDFPLLGNLLLGSLPGIFLGSHMGGVVPERALRSILATLLLLVGFSLALK